MTARMDAHGRLAWDVPPGNWIILRFGHTTTGKDNHPAPESGRGLECDKLSKAAAEAHFNGLMGRLIADNRALAGLGKTLVSTHIDSWEVGSQNWTPRMREEFRSAAATICSLSCLPSPAGWSIAWRFPNASCGTCGRRCRTC